MKAKKCTKCKKEKEPWEFNLRNDSPDGLEYHCRACRIKHDKISRRWRDLQYKFGITEAHYEIILKKQNGVCAICGQSETLKQRGKIQLLSVDHCHKTNRIRGILCNNCNTGIGKFQDDPELLRKVIKYLEKQ